VAQQAPPQQPRAGQAQRAQRDTLGKEKRGARGERGGERGMRGGFGARRGPGGGFLLRGITLTDAQKARLQQVREANKPTEAQRAQFQKEREELRALRQRGDTATLRARFAASRTRMEQERAKDIAAIRGILTAEQQKVFDANVAEAQKRQADRPARGGRGERRGR
jgi:Spy/CpxP family protein refolding chaperone